MRFVFSFLLLCSLSATAQAEKPTIVTSIKPVHALVAGVTAGVTEPVLLIQGAASPHDYSLRPSDVRAIGNADAVFWIGESLESVLAKPLANAPGVRSVALLTAPGLTLLPVREGGVWEGHTDDDDHNHAHDHAHAADDPHVWLNPHNAQIMVRHIAAVLGELDPAHAERYRQNAADLDARLAALDRELAAALEPVKNTPYIVFHDAYQYFEQRYTLSAVGAITLHPEQQPGARRVVEIRDHIRERQARCVFSEPQFQADLVTTLLADTGAQSAVLDPLGAELAAGETAYFELLRGLAAGLVGCLKP